MLTSEQMVDKNIVVLENVVKVVKSVTDKLVTSEVDGVLMKPATPAELESFRGDMNDIITNKLRTRLGV